MKEYSADDVFGPEIDDHIPPVPGGSLEGGHEWRLVTDPSTKQLTWVALPALSSQTVNTGRKSLQRLPDGVCVVTREYTSDEMVEQAQVGQFNGTWVARPDEDGIFLWHVESMDYMKRIDHE
jgi:hypothetical protein